MTWRYKISVGSMSQDGEHFANGYSGQMRQMTREQAREIYYRAFWLRYQCDELPEAVNHM